MSTFYRGATFFVSEAIKKIKMYDFLSDVMINWRLSVT